MRKGIVSVDGNPCGYIEEEEGRFLFRYTSDYLAKNGNPVSLTMPLREEPYISNILFPFFDGLIPEGFLLEMAVARFGIMPTDRMGLLLKTCRDCIGNVSVEEVSSDE